MKLYGATEHQTSIFCLDNVNTAQKLFYFKSSYYTVWSDADKLQYPDNFMYISFYSKKNKMKGPVL